LRQPIDERTRVCHRRRLQQFFIRCIRLPDLQVLADGAVKQKAFLRHHSDVLPQRANAETTNRTSVDQNLAAIELVEARQQIDHG
jgi:hypothetical protein